VAALSDPRRQTTTSSVAASKGYSALIKKMTDEEPIPKGKPLVEVFAAEQTELEPEPQPGPVSPQDTMAAA
jgi:hypothetical protein